MNQVARGKSTANQRNILNQSNTNLSAQTRLSLAELPVWLKVVLWLLVAGVFVVAPYLDGLYFYNHLQDAAIAITIVAFLAGLWLWTSKTEMQIEGFWKSFYPYFFLIGIIYFIDMLFRPAEMDYAVEGVIRYISLLGIVIILALLMQSTKEKKAFLGLLIITGAWTSVFGLANGYGTLHSAGALFQPGNRLSSVFQYANTNASFMAAFLFISFFYPILAKKKIVKILTSLATYLMLLNLTLTYSRGTWVTFAVLVVIMLLIVPKATRLPLLFANIAPFVAFLATLTYQIKAVQDTIARTGWTSLAVGAAATIVLAFVFQTWVTNRITQVPKTVKMILAAVCIVAVVFAGYKVALHGGESSIFSRLKTINLQQQSVQERFVYYKDGLRMFADHPVLGDGFGTWTATFQKYQSYPYWSKHEHSYVIETLVETGVVGALALIAALVFYVVGIIRTLKANRLVFSEQTILSLISLFVVASILLHAAIDFDLSYSLMDFLLWGMMVVGLQNVKIVQRGHSFNVQPLPGRVITMYSIEMIAMVGALLISITGVAADQYFTAAGKIKNNPTLQFEYIKNAQSLAQFNPQYALSVAQLDDQIYSKNKDVTYGRNAISNAQKAATLAPYDPTIQVQASQILFKYSQFDQALTTAASAYQNGLFGQQFPEQYMVYLVSQAEENLKKNPQTAKELAKKTVDVFNEAAARADAYKKLPPMPQERAFNVSDQMKLRVGEAYMMLGEAPKAQSTLQSVENSKDQTISLTAKMALDVMMGKGLYSGQGYGLQEQLALAQQIQTNPTVAREYQLLNALK